MKISMVPAALSAILCAALTFAVYSIASEDEYVIPLVVCTALTFLLTLGAVMSVSMEDSRAGVNLKVWSGLMFVLSLVVSFLFALIGVNLPVLIILETIILVIHLLVLWKCSK